MLHSIQIIPGFVLRPHFSRYRVFSFVTKISVGHARCLERGRSEFKSQRGLNSEHFFSLFSVIYQERSRERGGRSARARTRDKNSLAANKSNF